MSYYAADTSGYLQDVASVGGWHRFVEWASGVGGVLRAFVTEGHTDDPESLASVLELLEGPNESVESTRKELLRSAEMALDVLVVSDGTMDEVLRVAGGEGSGNFGHEGRPGEVGGSSDTGGTPVAGPSLPEKRAWAGESTFEKKGGYYAYSREIAGQKYGFFVSVEATEKAGARIKTTLDKLPAPFLTDLDTHGGIKSSHKVQDIGGIQAVGSYRKGAGEVWARSDAELENTLVHELGHGFYQRHYAAIQARLAWRKDVGTTAGDKPVSGTLLKKFKYYAGNSEEAIVESMAHILHPSKKSDAFRKAFPNTVKAVEDSFRKLGVIQ